MEKIYRISERELLFKDNVVKYIMRNLQAQGAPIGDDLELEDGWKMDQWALDDESDNKGLWGMPKPQARMGKTASELMALISKDFKVKTKRPPDWRKPETMESKYPEASI